MRAPTLVVALLLSTGCRGEPAPPTAAPVPTRDPWIDARQRGVDLRAVGQEPGWSVEVDHERSIRVVWDYAAHEATLPAAARQVAGTQTRYTSSTGSHRLTIVADEGSCHDGMSGQPFPLTVTVNIDGRELRGCGRAVGAENSSWRADARQVGPIRIGMSRSEAASAVAAPAAALGSPAPAGECRHLRVPHAAGVLMMFIGDAVARIDVIAPGIATEAGIEVGMNEARIHEAYGTNATRSPHKYTQGSYLIVAPDASHRVLFETDNGWVTRYRVGRMPEVGWVEGCG